MKNLSERNSSCDNAPTDVDDQTQRSSSSASAAAAATQVTAVAATMTSDQEASSDSTAEGETSDREEDEEFEDATETVSTSSKMDLKTAIEECCVTLHLFLNNKFDESRDRLLPWVDSSVYHALSYGAISFIQAIMTCDPVDIDHAVEALKRSLDVSVRHRRKSTLANNSVTKFVRRPNYNSYTDVQIHAELCYAESLLLRALISFIQDDNLMSFIKGGLKMRSCYVSYKECYEILEHRKWTDPTLKMHFQSGVLLGIGAFNLIISVLPTRVLRLLEFIGFSGNRDIGLQKLDEGDKLRHTLRGPLCSLCLLIYHSVITYALGKGDGDIDYAKKVLEPIFHDHPKGAILLYFAGRIEEAQGNSLNAISWLNKSRHVQQDWRQFHLLCFWELSWCHMFLGQWRQALQCMDIMYKESLWSKAISGYLKGGIMCMCPDLTADEKDELVELMKSIPSLKRRMAGKSIPMEKFFAKRSQRFLAQNNWLLLPALEMMYVWNYMIIVGKKEELVSPMLTMIERALDELARLPTDSTYYVDNYCLATFLKGVCLRYMNSPLMAEECFTTVFQNQKKIVEDVHLVPLSLLELGFLCIDSGSHVRAVHYLEAAKNNYKGYSLESRVHFKVHAGLLDIKRKDQLRPLSFNGSGLSPLTSPNEKSLHSPLSFDHHVTSNDSATHKLSKREE